MRITSLNSIKSSYIAEVLEEMGFPVRPAHNRLGERRVKTPKRLKPFIERAIRELLDEKGSYSYREIKERVMALLREAEGQSIVLKTRGMISEVRDLVKELADDEEVFYAG